MSNVTVLTDSTLSLLIKNHKDSIPMLQNVPTITKKKGCSCKGKNRKTIEVPDYDSLRNSIKNSLETINKIKQVMNVKTLVVFERVNGTVERHLL